MANNGIRYDVRDLSSVAFVLANEPGLRGLYRLTFANGETYAGQSLNVVGRFASHRRRWEDIVSFEFFPLPEGDLNQPEQHLIRSTEKTSTVRNIRHAAMPGGAADVEFSSSDGMSAILPWDRNRRIRPGQNAVGKDVEKFVEVASRTDYSTIREIAGWYLHETYPDPFNTQRHLWVSTCMPSTGKTKIARRLIALSAGNLETFVVLQRIIRGDLQVEMFINTDLVEQPLRTLQDPRGHWVVEKGSYKLEPVLTWHFTMESMNAIMHGDLEFPHLQIFLEAAYRLNVRLMRRGGTMFRRFHNELLASDLISASLKWIG